MRRATVLDATQLLDLFVALRSKIERVISGRTGDPALAADLAQELYLRLGRAPAFADADEAQRYLIKMAVNASIDHLRVEGRRSALIANLAHLPAHAPQQPEDAALTDDQIRRVDLALRELPEKCREMLFLSRVQGLTHGEIAQRMGVSRVLVEKYVARALIHCRARLLEEGG